MLAVRSRRESSARRRAHRNRPLGCESLEDRRLLSIDPIAQPLVAEVDWQGQATPALAQQWIARFDGTSGGADQQLAAIDARLDAAGVAVDALRYLGRDGTVLVQTSLAPHDVLSSLSIVAGFRYAEPNFTLTTDAVPNDPEFGTQWWLSQGNDVDIDAPEAWDITTGNGRVVMGVIDTGVDYTHTDLAANMWSNPGEIPGNGIDDDLNGFVDDVYGWSFVADSNDPIDVQGHGTSVAGIMGAVGNNANGIAGINWDTQIMALGFLNANDIGSIADAIWATNYATMMRTEYGVNLRVLNNSYGVAGFSQAFFEAVEAAGEAGILFVASAGNSSSNNDTAPVYPMNFALPNVISVAAIASNDALASFSSFGSTTVHLGAPGVGVRTTAWGGGTRNFSGTSAAAPVVAGVAGLLWEAAPYLTVAQIRQALFDGVVPTAALAGITVTGGRVNAANSLAELGLRVVQVTPDVDDVLLAQPVDFTIEFADAYDPATIAAGDLTVNGLPANSFTLTNANTVTFHFLSSPVTLSGVQTIHMAAGAVARAGDAAPMLALMSTFRFNGNPMTAVILDHAPGDIIDAGQPLVINVQLNRPVLPATVGLNDMLLSQGTVTAAELISATVIRYTIEGVRDEGTLHLSMPAIALKDLDGNLLVPLATTFTVDIDALAVDDFERAGPPGGLVYESLAIPGVIQSGSDEDSFVVQLSAGESLAAVATPLNPAAAIQVYLVGLAPEVSGVAGLPVQVGATAVPADGLYAVRVRGEATPYRLDLYRNTVLAAPGQATPLAPSRIALGAAARYAAIGKVLAANDPIYAADMSTNPGWTLQGQWNYGQPLGLGGDPASGFTGPNVLGFNLAGTYPHNMATTQYATSPAINTSGMTNVALSFRRWLGIESASFDHANIQVSTNGVNWTTVYNHAGGSFQENSWSLQNINLPAFVNNQPTVYVRFGMGPTDGTVSFSGWNIDDLVLTGTPLPHQDYAADWTEAAGKKVDVVLEGLDGVDFSGQTLQIIDTDFTTVLATATVTSANFDLGILDFVVPHAGLFTIRVIANVPGRYSLVVGESVVIESEANDTGEDPLRSLIPGGSAMGFVGLPPVEGLLHLQVDPNQSIVELVATLSSGELFAFELQPQSPGSLDAAATGTLQVEVDASGIRFLTSDLDLIANPGPFQPTGGAADFAGMLNIFGSNFFAVIRDTLLRVSSHKIGWSSPGEFNAQTVNIRFWDGEIVYSAFGMGDTVSVGNPEFGNQVSEPGTWEVLPGSARLTLPWRMAIEVVEPTSGLLATLELSATFVATMALPLLDDDVYEILLGAGQTLSLDLLPPLPPAHMPGHTLQSEMIVLNSLGGQVASVAAGAAGEPIHLDYVAMMPGNHRVVVRAAAGMGEYRLDADVTPLVAPAVVGRKLFYNQSKFDGNTAGASASDDGAIAPDKTAYLPGSGTATFANISSYTRGINGIMVDLQGAHGAITASDFIFKVGANNTPSTWAAAPAPLIVAVRAGAGVSGSDRIEIIWGINAPKNQWLQIIVKGNDATGGFNTNTGLAASDIFFFGSRIGDTGSGTATAAQTTAADEIATRNNTGAGATITNIFDHDRSGAVVGGDAIASRNNTGVMVKIGITNPPAAPEAEVLSAAAASLPTAIVPLLADNASADARSVGPWRFWLPLPVRDRLPLAIPGAWEPAWEDHDTGAIFQPSRHEAMRFDAALSELMSEWADDLRR